jgi:endonuclease/exonuclease/phosphatase (EEP) superfamily protein YafD
VPTFVARLDHLLVGPAVAVVELSDLDPIGSDHRPFVATLSLR